jgi:uncharacterized protein YqfA (UPF0365 family)
MKGLKLIIRLLMLVIIVAALHSCGGSTTNETEDGSGSTTQKSKKELVQNGEEVQTADGEDANSETQINWTWVFFALLFMAALISYVIYVPIGLWFSALSSGIFIWPTTMLTMRIQGVNIPLIINSLISARKAGITISIHELITFEQTKGDVYKVVMALITAHSAKLDIQLDDLIHHHHAHGDVDRVVKAMITATHANVNLAPERKVHMPFETTAAIDLAGVNVEQAIMDYVRPKVLETTGITAVAKDGIEITAKCRVTLRTDLMNLVTGPGEETILARINEAVVSIIGGTTSHKEILESAFEIGEKVLKKPDLWANCAYDVLSVDISHVEVGKDINAEHQAARAETKILVEKAKEQEMNALAAEARVHHIRAEAEVQQAMADAFRDGHISVKEYHDMQNMEADTNMRKSFSRNPYTDAKRVE